MARYALGAYALRAYVNRIPVYFTGLKGDGTPHFSSEPEEAEFGTLEEVEALKCVFEEKGAQFGPYEILEVEFVEE